MATKKTLLDFIEKGIRQGILTKATHVDVGTFICFTTYHPANSVYSQYAFEALPEEYKAALRGRKAGDQIGQVKVVAVFDMWTDVQETINEISLPKAS
jgi:hypothetical protein